MKYKKLTKEQIIISLDRLTRFKPTKEKYLRVFSDIITSNLIEPKLRKTDIENTDFSEITAIIEEIWNNSFETKTKDFYINNTLKEYENSIFINDEETQKLLNNKINYTEAIKYISDNCPVNLKWLKRISGHSEQSEESSLLFKNFVQIRECFALKYPVEKIILVEGITEEILLPAFSRYLGYDFYRKGIQIIAAGGKNQVVKSYYKLTEEVKIPIYILLDKDAENNINQIKPKLRTTDKIHLVSCGEFEDLLPHKLIIKTVNNHFENFLSIDESTLSENMPMAKILQELFRTKGLHEFKKAEFAKLVRENIDCEEDISDEIKNIIKEIFN